VEWTSGGGRDFADGRFFENSKSQELNGLCVDTTAEYKYVTSRRVAERMIRTLTWSQSPSLPL
jgi:hypothetical protein